MPVSRCSIPEPSTALSETDLCCTSRPVSQSRFNFCLPGSRPRKEENGDSASRNGLVFGLGNGRGPWYPSPPKVLKLCTYLASSPSATRVSKRISLVEEYEEEQMRLRSRVGLARDELFQGRGDRQIGGILGGSSQVASG